MVFPVKSCKIEEIKWGDKRKLFILFVPLFTLSQLSKIVCSLWPNEPNEPNEPLKVLANEDTLLRPHCCRHKCFPVCPRAQHLLRTQILCPGHKKCFWFCSETFFIRNKCFPVCARKETSWATMCPRQCVLVCQYLKYMNPTLNARTIIPCSFTHCRAKRAGSFGECLKVALHSVVAPRMQTWLKRILFLVYRRNYTRISLALEPSSPKAQLRSTECFQTCNYL